MIMYGYHPCAFCEFQVLPVERFKNYATVLGFADNVNVSSLSKKTISEKLREQLKYMHPDKSSNELDEKLSGKATSFFNAAADWLKEGQRAPRDKNYPSFLESVLDFIFFELYQVLKVENRNKYESLAKLSEIAQQLAIFAGKSLVAQKKKNEFEMLANLTRYLRFKLKKDMAKPVFFTNDPEEHIKEVKEKINKTISQDDIDTEIQNSRLQKNEKAKAKFNILIKNLQEKFPYTFIDSELRNLVVGKMIEYIKEAAGDNQNVDKNTMIKTLKDLIDNVWGNEFPISNENLQKLASLEGEKKEVIKEIIPDIAISLKSEDEDTIKEVLKNIASKDVNTMAAAYHTLIGIYAKYQPESIVVIIDYYHDFIKKIQQIYKKTMDFTLRIHYKQWLEQQRDLFSEYLYGIIVLYPDMKERVQKVIDVVSEMSKKENLTEFDSKKLFKQNYLFNNLIRDLDKKIDEADTMQKKIEVYEKKIAFLKLYEKTATLTLKTYNAYIDFLVANNRNDQAILEEALSDAAKFEEAGAKSDAFKKEKKILEDMATKEASERKAREEQERRAREEAERQRQEEEARKERERLAREAQEKLEEERRKQQEAEERAQRVRDLQKQKLVLENLGGSLIVLNDSLAVFQQRLNDLLRSR